MSKKRIASPPDAAPAESRGAGDVAGDAPLVRTYLPESLLVLLLCLTPVALPAVFYAFSVRRLASEGRLADARAASESARVWFIFSVCFGVTLNLAILGAYLVSQKS